MSDPFETLWNVAHQVPLSMGFPRQEYWSGLPFPSPGDLPIPGVKPTSPALAGGFFSTEPPGYCCSSISNPCPTLQPHGLEHTSLPCPSSSPRVCPTSCPLNQLCHPTISSCLPLLLLPSVFPNIKVFSSESAICIRWPSIGVSSSASVLPKSIQG